MKPSLLALLLLVPAIAGAKRPFITVQGARLMEGDKPFFFVGANLNVMHGPIPRGRAAETIAAAAADGLRAGRIWALGEDLRRAPTWKRKHFLFRAGPERWQQQAYLQLDRVIAEAGKRGLRLLVTLSNRWADYGGIPMYLRWAGHEDPEAYGYTDRFFTDPKCKRWFAEHVRRIVGRTNSVTGIPYRDDPTILAWELQNEMTGTPEAAAARRSWVAEMARMIRAIDPNHLVVPGLIGYNLQLERANWIRMCRLPEVSFCDQHIYPQEHLRSRGARNLRLYVDDRVQLAHHVVGKPVIFGEFGFADEGSQAARGRLHRGFLERVFYDGGNGALIWIYQPKLPWRRKFGVLVDQARYRPLRRQLGQVARQLLRQPVTARNPALGPAQGERPIAPTHATMTRWRRPHRAWRGREERTLLMPVDRFHRAWFEEAGSWDGGVLVHAYGRRTGWFDYRFVGPGFTPARLELALRLSSEYPSTSAPKHGVSAVTVRLDGQEVAKLVVIPDDGIGSWHRVTVTDAALLRRLARGAHTLRLEVPEGPQANGVAVFGRETALNREPVEEPGPIRVVAHRK